jgi:agmatinase
LEQGAHVLSLGGDHAITYPILRAYAKQYHELNVLHFDAHPDLYAEFEGNRYSHACPFARVMEEGLTTRLVQVGIRTMNPHQQAQAERFGVEVIDMRAWQPSLDLTFQGPVYVSLDMDVLDPAFAPGVSHHEPGGLSTRDVIGLIQGLRVPLVGADIVEVNPKRDPIGTTAMAAAKLLKEIAGCMLQSNR